MQFCKSFQILVFLLLIGGHLCSSSSSSSLASAASAASAATPIKDLILGVDAGTESLRAVVFGTDGSVLASASCPVKTYFPSNGWAEQLPADWWAAMGTAVSSALNALQPHRRQHIAAMCIDTTACSVVALSAEFEPLRPCLLWMDVRSASQTQKIFRLGKGDPALRVNCNGQGPISAEWMVPKAMWIKENEPEVWSKAAIICEKQDYLNYKLTGRLVASGCHVACRWHWDARTACSNTGSQENRYPGRPISLLRRIGLEDLLDKWPINCIPMGEAVGTLTAAAAEHLNLAADIPVIQGGPDAYVGMIGLGCVKPGQLALITGSSHLQLCITNSESGAAGTWGAYTGAILGQLNLVEGGQSSTGSVLSWARRELFPTLSYATLDDEAMKVPIGADGLVALETFQGSRTPVTDPLARGCLVGLSLKHNRSHIWRAFLEAVCFGTRAAVEALTNAGHSVTEVAVTGGATRSEFWTQMHSDVTGLKLVAGEFDNAPVLGAAILAAVGAKLFSSVETAVKSMVHYRRKFEPSIENKKKYDAVFDVYKKVSPAVASLAHSVTRNYMPSDPRPSSETSELSVGRVKCSFVLPTGRKAILAPSILSGDFGHLVSESRTCYIAGADWLHVDICDGGSQCPGSLTIGPSSVFSIKSGCPDIFLDVHVAVDNIGTMVDALLSSKGADRVTVQYESFNGDNQKLENVLRLIRSKDRKAGLCIRPGTDLVYIERFLRMKDKDGSMLIDLVDILAVNPGFPGQSFNSTVLDKVSRLHRNFPDLEFIMVDGGISEDTVIGSLAAGANVLVAGTSIFGGQRKSSMGIKNIRENLRKISAYIPSHCLP